MEGLATFERVPASASDYRRVADEPATAGVTPLSWLLILACLNVVDLFTTHAVIDRGGAEGNPLMAPLVEHGWAAWGMKSAVLWLTGILVLRCPASRRLAWALMLVNAWYAIVVCWNLRVLAYLG